MTTGGLARVIGTRHVQGNGPAHLPTARWSRPSCCAIARQKHDTVLSRRRRRGGIVGRAVAKQAEFLRPRQTVSLARRGAGVVRLRRRRPTTRRTCCGGPPSWRPSGAAGAGSTTPAPIYLPLRVGLEGVGFARCGGVPADLGGTAPPRPDARAGASLLAPLLEMEAWQVADLSHQMNAPAVAEPRRGRRRPRRLRPRRAAQALRPRFTARGGTRLTRLAGPITTVVS